MRWENSQYFITSTVLMRMSRYLMPGQMLIYQMPDHFKSSSANSRHHWRDPVFCVPVIDNIIINHHHIIIISSSYHHQEHHHQHHHHQHHHHQQHHHYWRIIINHHQSTIHLQLREVKLGLARIIWTASKLPVAQAMCRGWNLICDLWLTKFASKVQR